MPWHTLARAARAVTKAIDSSGPPLVTGPSAYPNGAPYVFVYPMVKTRAWYALSMEERRKAMAEHIAVGYKYPKIRINTSYS